MHVHVHASNTFTAVTGPCGEIHNLIQQGFESQLLIEICFLLHDTRPGYTQQCHASVNQ
jgi:hypothetical protein